MVGSLPISINLYHVYAGIEIKPNGLGSQDAVNYNGITYINIRSGKHSSSTAASHSSDFDLIFK